MIGRGIAAAVAAAVLLGASPDTGARAQRATAERYVAALTAGRYEDAFAMLDGGARAYFRSAANFGSGFTADGFRIASSRVVDARGNDAFRLFFVRESVRVDDPAHGRSVATTITVPVGVIGTGSRARIKDLGRPWRAYLADAWAMRDDLRVRVNKVSFYGRAVDLVVTFANLGTGFVTLLPYGRSVLRDGAGRIYYPIVAKPWTHTDRQLFLGVRLAARAEYTGVLSFATPRLDDRTERFTLTIAPSLRDGADAPFSLDIAGISPRA